MSTSVDSHTTVLIVGAGPTGLTLALSLLQHGVKVRLIDLTLSPHEAARGTAIMPRTQEALAILGVMNDVKEIATGPLQMAIYAPDGKTILKAFDWSQSAPESPTIPFRQTASISQHELEKILRHHLNGRGCKVAMGLKLIGIAQNDQAVTATVQIDEKTVDIKCDFLVAADGAKGVSRRLLDVSFLGETKEDARIWAANVQVPGFDRQYWHRWGDFASAATSLKPIYPEPWFQMLTLGPQLPKEIPTDLPQTQALFNSISKRSDLVLTDVSWVTEWKANIRMTDKFSVGRVFLAGGPARCHRDRSRSQSGNGLG
ncbi:Pentachlorophenol 4-monooxygenase [Mycena indigotica]|uniref:Pentachlorophenol 4-monooxygenase n=1 Tax=Mycena indigotica TaxID=2126181 RepID=A0A8H6VPL0_9AGAR|nr:Pentachlorophenol 4-monooxygenase [Mycena indigotica]KAF7288974.1 Pentachlorophenol 4-monooxygenase [Mycena indigotica]